MSGAPLQIEVSVEAEGWPEGFDVLAEQAIVAALDGSEAVVDSVSEVSVLLIDDAEQQQLNAQWRGIDRPTNVLSFPLMAPFSHLSGLVGDITLARETLERESAELGIPLADHFTHLVVHGFLHLLGYDHLADDEAAIMEGLETRILAGLGIADPYADD